MQDQEKVLRIDIDLRPQVYRAFTVFNIEEMKMVIILKPL
jgi:hypothetical protein